MNGLDKPTIGYMDLRIEKVAAQVGIDRRTLTLARNDDMIADTVIYQLVRKVATVPGVEQITVPATWWEALKEAEVRRSPIMRWWVRRRPIRHRTYRALEVLPNFPELDRYRGDVRIARLLPVDDDLD